MNLWCSRLHELTFCATFAIVYFAASILTDLLNYAKAQEADVKALAQEIELLQQEKYISYETTIKYLNIIGKKLNDEQLGLHIGEQISLNVTAYVDRIMEHSYSLEEAFENAAAYSKLISDALETSLHKTESHYSVRFIENPDWKVYPSHGKKQILDLTLLSCLKSLVAYTNRRYYPVKLHLESAKPKNLNEYYRLFNCSLIFNQSHSEIFFEKQIFDQHTRKPQFGLLQSLKDKVEDEISRLETDNSLVYALKKSILSHKPERIDVTTAASSLNLSSRTLQRKLKALNTSFKSIEYELQLRLSKTYLEEGKKSIDEISYLLGFSESSAFIRFFKSLTGTTPNKYR